jgi:Concanavalin A-like lectin/glucanases superfamily
VRLAAVVIAALALAGAAGAVFTARTTNASSSLTAAASFECGYPALVTGTAGIAGYWRLGETSGTTATDSAGSANGTYSGPHTLGVSGAVAGDANAALRLAGGSVDMGDNHDFAGTSSFTLEAWVRPTTIDGASRRVVSKAAALQGYELFVNSGSGISFQRIAGSTNTVSAAAPVLNAWSHIAATYDGTTMRLYVNGSQVGSTASALSLLDTVAPLRVGNSAVGSDGWAGDVDDVALYTGALGAAQIQSHFRCGHRYRDVILGTPGLQSYWRLGEASGVTAFDSKGTANGTLNGPSFGGAGATTHPNDALTLDGVDDYVDFGDVHDVAGTSSFTLEAWINRTTLGEADRWRWIVTKQSIVDPRDGWALVVAPNDTGYGQRLWFSRFSAGTEHVALSTTVTAANTWYHVAASYDGATMRVYVNGVLEGSTASAMSMPNTTFPLRISSAAPPSVHRFPGRLDEVAVYNVALSGAQVREHHAAR